MPPTSPRTSSTSCKARTSATPPWIAADSTCGHLLVGGELSIHKRQKAARRLSMPDAGVKRGLDVSDAVCERESEFQSRPPQPGTTGGCADSLPELKRAWPKPPLEAASLACRGAFDLVQDFPHLPPQRHGTVRFLQVVCVRGCGTHVFRILRIPAGKNDRETSEVGGELLRRRHAAQLWHDHVENGDRRGIFRARAKGLLAVGCRKHAVTQAHQGLARHLADGLMILGDKNGFRPAQLYNGSRGNLGRRTFSHSALQHGEVHAKEASLTGLAGNMNESAVLLHDAVHGRQPHSGAFAFFLGGEERLENPLARFRVHSRSEERRVGKGCRCRKASYRERQQ